MNFLKRFFAPAAALLAVGSTSAEARAPHVARPALWQVSDADTTIYLFGTIHLLPENYQWRTKAFDRAVEGSQQLVVETIVDDKNPTKLMSAMAGLAFSKGLPPIAERVPVAKRKALEAAIAKSGAPRPVFDQLETWAAAFLLLGNQFRDLGLKGQDGVEAVLRNSFAAQGKSVGELESNVEQLGFFDRLPETAQRDLLLGAIDPGQNMDLEFGGMLGSWARGDVPGIARSFDRDLSGSPDLRNALIWQRNASWRQWIEQRMAQPGTVMVAVGAGHLAGDHSVIALLEKDGYRVRRVQ